MIDQKLVEAIDSVEAEQRLIFGYLGASTASNECQRKVWYSYRNMSQPLPTPSKRQRIFDLGTMAEETLYTSLERAGAVVYRTDPATDGKQYTVTMGPLKCKIDGLAVNVPGYGSALMVLEIKSHNQKSYGRLNNETLINSNYDHYGQLTMGGTLMAAVGYEVGYLLYGAINKNTCDIYPDVMKFDYNEGMRHVNRALNLAYARFPPPVISTSESFWRCNYCAHKPICKGYDTPLRHCRTCSYSEPLNKVWYCAKHNVELTPDQQAIGCTDYAVLRWK